MIWMLRLYPRAWRRRYGDEAARMLAAEPHTLRGAVDLLAGAIDAHLNPQWTPRAAAPGGERGDVMMSRRLSHCHPADVTAAEYRRSIVWLLTGSFVLALAYVGLSGVAGDHALVEGFGMAAFPLALVLSSGGTFFKKYSPAARRLLMAGVSALVLAISIVAALLA
jgi:hypothetical protein